MIEVTRLNDTVFYVNPHQIEFMEKTPDTVITMVSGRKVLVKESVSGVVDKIVKYRTRLVNEDTLDKPSFYGNEE